MEYDDKATPGKFEKWMIPAMKHLVKKMADGADNPKCQPGLLRNVQPLQMPPEPACWKFYLNYKWPKLKNGPSNEPPRNQVTIED